MVLTLRETLEINSNNLLSSMTSMNKISSHRQNRFLNSKISCACKNAANEMDVKYRNILMGAYLLCISFEA